MATVVEALDQALARAPKVVPAGALRATHPNGTFSRANSVDTRLVLDRCGIEFDEKFARCPGCAEPKALICENGGIKCLHARCADAGPVNFPGFRSNVDIVAQCEGIAPSLAAEQILRCRRIEQFSRELEPRLGPGCELSPICDWANKLAGGIARVAAVLRLAEVASFSGHSGNCGKPDRPTAEDSGDHSGYSGHSGNCGRENKDQIEVEAVDRAILIGRYLLTHAQAAFALMGTDPEIENARQLLSWIRSFTISRFTKRDDTQTERFRRAGVCEAQLNLRETVFRSLTMRGGRCRRIHSATWQSFGEGLMYISRGKFPRRQTGARCLTN